MKKACVLILVIALLGGCSGITHYDYKRNISFKNKEFQKAPHIGIAMYHNKIHGLNDVIKADCERFAQTSLIFSDLSAEIKLTTDRQRIENQLELVEKYPDIRYILATFEQEPQIKKNHGTRSEDAPIKINDNLSLNRESEYYETIMRIPCDILLFNLIHNRLIAKAQTVFRQSSTHVIGSPLTFSGFIEHLLESSADRYPKVESVDASRASQYFYFFLKHIDYADAFDFEYAKWGFLHRDANPAAIPAMPESAAEAGGQTAKKVEKPR